jgi:HEPN domain-containing protein
MPDRKFVLEWIYYATSDLRTARHMFEDLWPKETEISAWHSQRCAEKALKAVLVANDIDPPKTHDLEKLNDLCQNIDKDFSQLEMACKTINPYGVASRYPREIAADEAIIKILIEKTQSIYDFCVAKINLLIQS